MVSTALTRKKENERIKLEKEQKELEAIQRQEEEKKKRDAANKARNAERKKVEENEKQAKGIERREEKGSTERKANVTGKSTAGGKELEDSTDNNTNEHINTINRGAGEKDMEEDETQGGKKMEEEEVQDPASSPQRKRSRKEKKKKKNKRKTPWEPDKEDGGERDDIEMSTPPSVLRRGKFSGGRVKATKKILNHKHKRWVVECSLILRAEGQDKYQEFNHAMKMLLQNGQKVDPTLVIETVIEGKGDQIREIEDIPINFTDLSVNVKVSGGSKAFQMKQLWKKDGEVREDDELQDPEVYFAIAFSSNEEPEEVVDRISCEWGRLNGKKMWLKAIPSFKTETPVAIYHLLNSGHQRTLITELKQILEQARDAEAQVEFGYEWEGKDIPAFGLSQRSQDKTPLSSSPGQKDCNGIEKLSIWNVM